MEEKKIRDYIGGYTTGLVITVLLVLLALGCVLLGLGKQIFITANTEAEWFDPLYGEEKTDCYIDVVAISDWVYEYDKTRYYAALDDQGYFFVVHVNNRQLESMRAQRDYWDDEDLPVPTAFRLTGLSFACTDHIRDAFCQVYDLSDDEFENLFGVQFLNATTSSGQDTAAFYYLGAFFAGMFAVVFGVIFIPRWRQTSKTIRALQETGDLERVLLQLESETNYVIGKNRGLITRDYLIGRGTGIVLPIAELCWAYQRNQKVNFVPANAFLMVSTSYKKDLCAVQLGKPAKDEIQDAMSILYARNPSLILGFSKEAQNTYKTQYQK